MAVLDSSVNLNAPFHRNDTGDNKRLTNDDAAGSKESEPPYPAGLPGSLASTSAAVAKMMRLWNYREGLGLGSQGQGIVGPIQPTVRRRQNAGIGHREGPYDNGLHSPPPPVEDEWRVQWEKCSRALQCEEECCEKVLALLQDRKLQGDESGETAHALAAIVKSKEVFQGGREPGAWKATLPSSTSRYIVEQVIVPWLTAELRRWQPSWDPDCYNWMRPSIPLVGHLPESLYDAVESKISGGDYDTVAPWKEYLDPVRWDIFARRHVLPRLTRMLRELRITPPKQMDSLFRAAMLWAPLVDAADVVPILEAEFFDKWEGALRHWLRSSKPSLGEATAWCTGWKNLFTPELLADERVVARLEAGVATVNREVRDLESRIGYRL